MVVFGFCEVIFVISWMSPDSPQKTTTRGPLWSFCVGPISKELRALAVVDTWPTMKLRSSCSCPTLSRCRSRSPVRSTSTAGPVASRWPASKVKDTSRVFTVEEMKEMKSLFTQHLATMMKCTKLGVWANLWESIWVSISLFYNVVGTNQHREMLPSSGCATYRTLLHWSFESTFTHNFYVLIFEKCAVTLNKCVKSKCAVKWTPGL